MMLPPPVRALRSASYGVLALGTALALSACSGPDPDELRAGPVPETSPELDKSELPPKPKEDAPITERVEWSLIETTSVYARWYGDGIEADCPGIKGTGGFGSQDVTCTVAVDGVSAEWDVSVGSIMSEFEPLDGRHVVRDAVEDVARFETGSEHVRCEMDKVQLASPDDEEPITCVWATEDDHGRLALMLDDMQFSDKSFWLTSAE
ncbi:hypothetical protein [Nocardiopsis rhodophaea]